MHGKLHVVTKIFQPSSFSLGQIRPYAQAWRHFDNLGKLLGVKAGRGTDLGMVRAKSCSKDRAEKFVAAKPETDFASDCIRIPKLKAE